MAEFEFAQNLSFGEYIPNNSWFQSRDPRAKIVFLSALIIAITFSKNLYFILSALVFSLILFLLAKIPLKNALRAIRIPLPFLIIIAIFQLFRFAPSIENPSLLSWKLLSITALGVEAGVLVLLRFLSLILFISLGSSTLSSSDLIHGMQSLLKPLNWLKIPSEDLIIIIQITLRFLPILGETTEKIAKAQAARGAAWGIKNLSLPQRVKLVMPVIVPMFLTSLQNAETMAMAIDSRGYGAHLKRGSYRSFRIDESDLILILSTLVILPAGFFL